MKHLKTQYFTLKKRKRNSQKLTLKKLDYKTIEQEFYSWLSGVQEDDPLPHEISVVCLCFNFDNNAINLSVSGFENEPFRIDNGSYFPLEAQYFYCELLNAFVNNKQNFNKQNKLNKKVKLQVFVLFYNMLKNAFTSPNFCYLNNKKIIIGEFLHEKNYSFRFVCKNA